LWIANNNGNATGYSSVAYNYKSGQRILSLGKVPMSAEKFNTHLASEFYVLSALHRLGAEATLTLGNKKAVDIVVVRDAGEAFTLDVKGLAGTTGWPVDNVKSGRKNHFLVFVCFKNKIADLSVVPEVYVLPSDRLDKLTYHAPGGKRHIVQVSRMRADAEDFRDAWHLILGPSTHS
jgi:hypothetical protein